MKRWAVEKSIADLKQMEYRLTREGAYEHKQGPHILNDVKALRRKLEKIL